MERKEKRERRERSRTGREPAGRSRGLLKKGTAILMMTIAALTLCGCGARHLVVSAGLEKSPYYHLGDTEWDHGGIEEYYFDHLDSSYNEIYRELYSRLSNREDSGDLYAQVSADDFWKAYFAVLADHPELFWVGSSAQTAVSNLTGKVVSYQIESTVPADQRDEMKQQLDAAADACIAQTDETWSDYGRIKSVYEYLINQVDYDVNAPSSQCAQSALLYHKSVCAGYAKAFQYILHRMGYFCTYVTGKIKDGAGISSGSAISITMSMSPGATRSLRTVRRAEPALPSRTTIICAVRTMRSCRRTSRMGALRCRPARMIPGTTIKSTACIMRHLTTIRCIMR